MAGNYTFPSLADRYMAPGGQSTFTGADGSLYITYHQRFDRGDEYHEPRVHKLFLNRAGWYVMSPFETTGEAPAAEGYRQSDVEGTFYLLDHGRDVSDLVQEAKAGTFSGGKISGEWSGTYEVEEGTHFLKLTIDGAVYDGVIVPMDDEAGNPVLCLMAAGENDRTVWGVKYLKE